MAVELATAYVSLTVSADGLLDKVRAELGAPLTAAAKKAGERAGSTLGRELADSAKDTGKQLGKNLDAGVSDGLKGIGTKLAGAFAAVQVGSFLKGAVGAAADTAESMSKLTVLVGESADGLDEWAQTTAEAFGISRQEALKAAGTFATFFRGVGKSQEEAAGMSRELTELAADIASFSNTSPEQAIEALGAALRGESEPIRAYGVLLDDATLKTRAFNLGLISTTKEALAPAIRVQAAYAEILAQTGNAQGDFARTSDGLAGSQKQLAAQFKDAQASLGEALLPAMSALVGVAQDLLPSVAELATNFAGLAGAAGEAVVPMVGLVGAFATSDFGTAAISAAAAAFAIAKIGDAAKVAATGLTGLATANPILLALGAAAGVAASVYLSIQADAADAAEASESLGKALIEAQDPMITSRVQAEELAEAFGRLAGSTGEAEETVVAFDAAWAGQQLLERGTLDVFNKAGLDIDRLVSAARRGADALPAFQGELNDAIRAGRINRDEYAELADEVEFLGAAFADQAELTKTAQEAAIALADTFGVLTPQQIELARSAKEIDKETRQFKSAFDILLPTMIEAAEADETYAAAARDLAGATGPAAGAVSDLAGAAADSVGGVTDAAGAAEDLAAQQKIAESAAKAHDDALKELAAEIDGFIGSMFDGEAAADAWARSLGKVVDLVTGQKLTLEIDNVGSGSDIAGLEALAAESEAAIKRLRESGAGAEEVAAAEAAATAEIAAQRANLGIASEENQRAFEGFVSEAERQVDDLIKRGGSTVEIAALTDTLVTGLRAKADELGVVLKDNAVTLAGNSKFALEGRELFRGLVEQAQVEIQKLIDGGASIETVTGKAAELGKGVFDTATTMGLSAPSVQGYADSINGIALVAIEANKQLSAIPTQLSIDLAYTMTLDAEQFKAELAVAAQAFQDALSREYVELGILEIDGASFALPRRAAGGPVSAGQPYVIGERGPEVFVPNVGGVVIPNNELAMAGTSGGPVVGTMVMNQVRDPAAIVDEINARLGWMLTTRNER